MSMHPDLQSAILAEIGGDPGYGGKSAAEIADMLNAPQQAPAPSPQPRPFSWRSAKALAQEYGRWSLIALRARSTPAIPPASAADFATLTAINALSMADDQQIDPAHPVKWATFCGGLASLVAVGDLTAEIAAEIEALGSYQPPAPPPSHPRWVDVVLSLPVEAREGLPNAISEDMVAEALA